MVAELDVLLEQLEELLGQGAFDAEDALELAAVAGMAARLDESHEAVKRAVEWREGPGEELLTDAFDHFEGDEILNALEAVLTPDADEEAVEEALFELDEVVAAALWCGRRDAVSQIANEAERLIRQVPEPFAQVSDLGVSMARLPAVGMSYDIYGFWMAVADAGR
ncbi:MAG: hypothetical protein EP330_24305 [Deltaproteobacteria bacterium]|nr:MAG: hypothetical protein EP330_24305 [Deltaproteobacteria bacterium]